MGTDAGLGLRPLAPSRVGGGQQPLLTVCFCCRCIRSCWGLAPGLGAACLLGCCGSAGPLWGLSVCVRACVQSNKVFMLTVTC